MDKQTYYDKAWGAASFKEKESMLYSILEIYKSSNEKLEKENIVKLLKNILFEKNHGLQLKSFLQCCFEKTEGNSIRHLAVFKVLNKCCKSERPKDCKVGLFKLVVEAVVSSATLEDLEVLRFIVLVGYLLGIQPKQEEIEILLDSNHVDTILKITSENTFANLEIWNEVLRVAGKRSLNLSIELPKLTGLQWFRSFTISLLTDVDFNEVHISTLTAILFFDSSVLEPLLSKIFKRILGNERFSASEEYREQYEIFLNACLKNFSRLQRISKLISKLIPAIASLPATSQSQQILSPAFLETLSSVTTLLPSAHGLGLIQILVDELEGCISSFKEDKLNSSHLRSVGLLLCTVLSGSRLLCYSLPRTVIETFIALIDRFKILLARFGTIILQHQHDRGIMQPFLRLCHIWGETNALVTLYALEDEHSQSFESAPSDLSPSLPFLSGDQWSVFSERIANFGDQQCNQLLMKLLVQKLRVASLAGERMKLETTAKYLVDKLKSNVHGVELTSVMDPKEMNIVLDALPEDRAKMLVQILFEQLQENIEGINERWLQDKTLLENRKFVTSIFEVALKDILTNVKEEEVRPPLRSLYQNLQDICASDLLLTSNGKPLRTVLNETFTVEPSKIEDRWKGRFARACVAFNCLPFGVIASFGDFGLISITATMVSLDMGDILLPVFERLFTLSKSDENPFDLGLCIQWLAANISDRTARIPIIELLVKKCTATELGLKQFKRLIKSFNGSNLEPMKTLEVQVQLHNSIRKCWRQGSDPQTVLLNDEIAKQRRRLNHGLRTALEVAAAEEDNSNSGWVLLEAYAIELMRQEREGNVDEIVKLNFDSYFKKALKGAKKSSDFIEDPEGKSCLNFLITVLKCMNALRPTNANKDLVFSVWRQMKGHNCPALWQHLCLAASEEEFQRIMMDLLKSVQTGLCPPEEEVVSWGNNAALPNNIRPLFIKSAESNSDGFWSSHYIDIWQIFLSKSTGTKQKSCYDAIHRLVSQPRNILPRTPKLSSTDYLLNWLKFLHLISSHPSIPMWPGLENYLLDVVLAAPENPLMFTDHVMTRVNILSTLLSPQKVPVLRKVPLIFRALQKLLRWLIRESDTNTMLSQEEVSSRALAAFHVEKLIGLFVRRKEHHLIPLLISDMIVSMGSNTLYPSVKLHLNNAIFSLLGIADEHAIKYLLRTLPPGCRQVLSHMYSEFQKFHKYKGKI